MAERGELRQRQARCGAKEGEGLLQVPLISMTSRLWVDGEFGMDM
jgi:hypothetical protein